MTRYLLTILFVLSGLYITAQENDYSNDKKKFIIAFYNVENLFDTIDDPAKRDGGHLPDAKIPWTSERYLHKLRQLDSVLSSLNENIMPGVIGLCEVENRQVLEDLVLQPGMSQGKYDIIHYESPDERGIDNALLYDKKQFVVLESSPIPVHFAFAPEDKTRDILYVKGVPKKSRLDTLHLFVNHWTSRWGGREETNPKRAAIAKLLAHNVASILEKDPEANIILMGDFNDEPADPSLAQYLKAEPVPETPEPEKLYNLMYADYLDGHGTIYWKNWDMFDMFIVSGNLLLKEKGMVLTQDKGHIFGPEWLMYETDKGILRPSRTASRSYYGGYSDHLPVYIMLYKK